MQQTDEPEGVPTVAESGTTGSALSSDQATAADADAPATASTPNSPVPSTDSGDPATTPTPPASYPQAAYAGDHYGPAYSGQYSGGYSQYPYPGGAYASAPGTGATTGAWPGAAPGTAGATGGYPGGDYGAAPPGTAPTQVYGPSAYPPRRRLTRSQDDRVAGGVLGGLARYWNTDPLLLRILTIVLTIATGGALLIGYIIAWIVIPLEPSSPSGWTGGTGYASGGNPTYAGPGSAPAGTAPFEAPPRPPRSYLGWLVISVGLILVGALAVIGLLVEPTSGFAAFISAVVLIVLGAGLIAGAWYGRARWLIVLAIPMVFITMAAVATNAWVQSPAADRWFATPEGGVSVGSRVWTVTPADVENQPLEYRVTAGDAQLDLTQLTALGGSEPGAPGQRVTVNAGVGLGELIVVIPADMQVNLAARVRAGEVSVPAARPGQVVVERNGTNLDVNTTIESVAEGQPAYVVDLDVAIGAGSLEVRREAA